MKYSSQFPGSYVGDAYERMFLNAAKGDSSLFVSAAELVEAWRIFTPLLHQIDEQKPSVVVYPFGSRFPPGFDEWSKAHGVTQSINWQQSISAATSEALTTLFKELDTDESGTLTASEVATLASKFYDGREPTTKKVSEIINRMDTNADGVITLEELLSAHSALQNAFGTGEGEF